MCNWEGANIGNSYIYETYKKLDMSTIWNKYETNVTLIRIYIYIYMYSINIYIYIYVYVGFVIVWPMTLFGGV